MVTAIITVFILGYAFIATEGLTKLNKAGVAILMSVICWVLFAVGGFGGEELHEIIERNLGEAGTTLFFLMGAMAIVELVDSYGGFNFVRRVLQTTSKKSLLWKMAILTAFLSAVLDNLTTTIVMLMILNKLVSSEDDKLIYASMIVIAANAGGAFSPIGDVTTIMLWNGGMVSAVGVISSLLLPSVVSFVVPCLILQGSLKGSLALTPAPPKGLKQKKVVDGQEIVKRSERIEVFIIGVGGLCCVPVFHSLTGLPPFVGILAVLGLLWILTDFLHRHVKKTSHTITHMFARIDMSTIMFFLGILMSVSVLSEIGVLNALGMWLSEKVSNSYIITGVIGILSSIVDNVPLVAGAMKMYPVADATAIAANPELMAMAQDGIFWQLLAYCAGVGGSMLIIGSAAGVVAMGTENISFGWYMKHISWIALVGYLAGMAVYFLEDLLILA